MEVLGRDVSRARMRQALEVLGGPSKKESEAWSKELEALLKARGEGADEEE
jgi:glutamyl-tRNA synthetase